MHKRKRIKKLESRLMFTTAAKQAIVEKKIEWILQIIKNYGRKINQRRQIQRWK